MSIVAKWLGVDLPGGEKKPSPTDQLLEEHPKALMEEIQITEHCSIAGKRIVDLKFPKNAIIAMIERESKYLTPNGSTVINIHDKLIVLSDSAENLKEVKAVLKVKSV